MTIPLLWPPEDESPTCELPVGLLRLTGKVPTTFTTGYQITPSYGSAGISRPVPIEVFLPLARLRLGAGAIASKTTANVRCELELKRLLVRNFPTTYQVRYSDKRQAEDDEAIALICSLIH
jgi:hypothetical protein